MKTNGARVHRMAHHHRGKEFGRATVAVNASYGIGLTNRLGSSWVILEPDTRRWATSRRWRRV